MEQEKQQTRFFPAPTREGALYILALLLTLITRVAALGRFALTSRELQGSVAALSWLRGESLSGLTYSPLQWLLQVPLFALMRTSEFTARAPTALAAVALVLAIYAQRRVLGRMRALCLTLLVTVSPTLLHYSRQADGAYLAAAAAVVATLCGYRAMQPAVSGQKRTQDWCWFAVSVAVGLTAGQAFWTWLFAAALLIWWRLGARRRVAGSTGTAVHASQPLLWGAAALVGISTAVLLHPAGFGAALGLLADWGAALAAPGRPWYWPLSCLALYEPLLVILGACGAARAWRAHDRLGQFALLWFVVALLFGLIGQRDGFWMPGIVAPLALLAADGVPVVWAALCAGRGRLSVVAGIGLAILLAFSALSLLMYANSGQVSLAWLSGGAALVVCGLWVGLGVWEGWPTAQTVGWGLLLIILTMMTVRTGVAVAYQTARDPREPLVYDAVALSPRQWDAFLSKSSLDVAGDQRSLRVVWSPDVDLEARWYLRSMPDAHAATAGNWAGAQAVLVAPAEKEVPPAGYVGQRMVWRKSWSGEGLPSSEQWRWLLLRQPVGWEQDNWLALWYQLER